MANNPYVNKVEFGNQTVMDISDTTATEADVAEGKTFYKGNGQRTTGTGSYYSPNDSASADIANADLIPFYDDSASEKKNSTWANIVAKIKTALGIASSGNTFLRKDGTWATPTDTTYNVVSKTADGLAPQLPNETATTKFLRQDGSWAIPNYPSVPSAYTSNPAMDGTASAGSSGSWARGDHVHPTDTTRAAASDLTSHTGNTSNPHSVTKSQVGLDNVPNVSTNDQTPTFSQASSRANIASGEKLSVILGKIMKYFADLGSVAYKNTTGSTSTYLRGDGSWVTPPNDKVRQDYNGGDHNYLVLLSPSEDEVTVFDYAKKNTDFYYNPLYQNLVVPNINGNNMNVTTGTITWNTSVVTGHSEAYLRKWGRLCTFMVRFTTGSNGVAGETDIATIPKEYHPGLTTRFSGIPSWGSNTNYFFTMVTRANNVYALKTDSNLPANSMFIFTLTYLTTSP